MRSRLRVFHWAKSGLAAKSMKNVAIIVLMVRIPKFTNQNDGIKIRKMDIKKEGQAPTCQKSIPPSSFALHLHREIRRSIKHQ